MWKHSLYKLTRNSRPKERGLRHYPRSTLRENDVEAGKNMTLNSLKQASKALGAVPVVKFYVRDQGDDHYIVKKQRRKKRT